MLWLGSKGEKEVCEQGDPGWGKVAPEGAEGAGGLQARWEQGCWGCCIEVFALRRDSRRKVLGQV